MTFRQLISLVVPSRGTLTLLIALLTLGSAVALAIPLLLGKLALLITGDADPLWTLNRIMGAWLLLLIARTIIAVVADSQLSITAEVMSSRLRRRYFQHLLAVKLPEFRKTRSGELLTLMDNDAEEVSSFVTTTLVQVLPAAVLLAGAYVMLLYTNILLGMVIIGLVPLYFLILKWASRSLRPLSREWLASYGHVVAQVTESISMMATLKAFSRESNERERFDHHEDIYLGLSRRHAIAQALIAPATGFAATLGIIALVWLGFREMTSGALSPDALVQLILYAGLTVQPLRTIAGTYGNYQSARGAADRLIYFFNLPTENGATDSDLPFDAGGGIHFERVTFGYDPARPVLEDVTFTVSPGEKLMVTGANGAGKSTLIYLLMRFDDPQAGRITLGDIDIASLPPSVLRSRIGLVSQMTELKDGSIRDNIAYGRPDASADAVHAAAARAGAHRFIEALPDGYDTQIGEGGVRLSGGQRQLLALARALLVDAPIIVFDEATSMVDEYGKASFRELLNKTLKGKTVIVLTHDTGMEQLFSSKVRL